MNMLHGTDLNVLTLVKGEERYVFLYGDDCRSRSETLRQLGRFAANKELSFTWHDAAVLANRIRKASEAVQ